MSDVSDPGPVQRLAAISFDDDLKAVEFDDRGDPTGP